MLPTSALCILCCCLLIKAAWAECPETIQLGLYDRKGVPIEWTQGAQACSEWVVKRHSDASAIVLVPVECSGSANATVFQGDNDKGAVSLYNRGACADILCTKSDKIRLNFTGAPQAFSNAAAKFKFLATSVTVKSDVIYDPVPAILGITLGCICFTAIVLFALWVFGVHRYKKNKEGSSYAT